MTTTFPILLRANALHVQAFRTSATRLTRPNLQLVHVRTLSTASYSFRSLPCLSRQRPEPSAFQTQSTTLHQQRRTYASKKKSPKSTADFVPGSRQPITDPAALEEYTKAEAAMKTATDWFRKECAASESRAMGRVTPALLSSVKVKLPDSDGALVKLEEIATVGVREGSTLIISLFDEHNMKHVESALYDSGIPGVVPHRQDNRTIKVPIPKPTVEARTILFTAAKRKSEDIRQQIRKQHTTSLKRGKFEKHSVEVEEFQKLTDRYIKEVDVILASLQKATGGK